MIDGNEIMPLNFFAYGGVYSGEHEGMRYKLRRIGEKPDFLMEAVVWKGPFASDRSEIDESDTFPFDEKGREAAIEWISQQFEDNLERYSTKASLLETEINLDKMYASDTEE